ncbi:MAG TPA: glycosyltransferase [Flavobacterium sp.]|nr:glycosyltransferase [Flavobacterium sp.]
MAASKNILVAPLNWGLGHATRCIPIINNLIKCGFNPILASDGASLALLKKEFPSLVALELPSYEVKYSRSGKHLRLKLTFSALKMLGAVRKEKRVTNRIIKEHNISGIISDNRFGVYSKQIPSVFMTHQLNVLSGTTTQLTSYIHQKLIKKFDQCWIPDVYEKPNLSGFLGHLQKSKLDLRYLGAISRFEKKEMQHTYDLAVVLSGPEPQRSIFEEIITKELKSSDKKVIVVRGIIETKQKSETMGNTTFYNFMQTPELEQLLNQSAMVLSRSGYTTVLDLARLEKKAFFVPTPGQTEQEYLAKKLKVQKIAPYATQEDFNIEMLTEVERYKGFKGFDTHPNWEYLFEVFSKES